MRSRLGNPMTLLIIAAVFTAPNVELPYSTSAQQGSFDVDLAGDTGNVASFNAEVYLTSFCFSGLRFVSPNTEYQGGFATTHAAFTGNPLMTVTYSVPANTSGLFPIRWAAFPLDNTQAFDAIGGVIPSTYEDGSILIQSPRADWSGVVDSSWNTVASVYDNTNWTYNGVDTHIPPTALTDVYFDKAANVSLGQAETIQGLFITANTALNGGGLFIGKDGLNISNGATLTLGAAGINGLAMTPEPSTGVYFIIGVLSLLAMRTWRWRLKPVRNQRQPN